jgi:preprotein translocase subunit SecG
MWLTLILVVHVLAALGVIGLVLLQHGKGADVGAAFGSGASGSLFGATGSANFLSRTTAILAAVFFLSSLGLAYLANVKPKEGGSVMDAGSPPAAGTPPAPGTEPSKAPAPKGSDVPK